MSDTSILRSAASKPHTPRRARHQLSRSRALVRLDPQANQLVTAPMAVDVIAAGNRGRTHVRRDSRIGEHG